MSTPARLTALKIDQLCRRFEREWHRQGSTPDVNAYLETIDGDQHEELLRELILVDWQLRRENSHSPEWEMDDWIRQFPMFADTIAALDPEAECSNRSQEPIEPAPAVRMSGDRLGDFQLLRQVGRGGMGVVYEARQLSLDRTVALKLMRDAAVDSQQVARFQREARAVGRLHHGSIVDVYGAGEHDGQPFLAMQFVEGCSLDGLISRLRSQQHASTRKADENLPVVDEATSPLEKGLVASSATTAGRFSFAARLTGQTPHSGSTSETETFSQSTQSSAGTQPFEWSSLRNLQGREQFAAKVGAEIAAGLQYAINRGVLHRDIKPSNILIDPDGHALLSDFGLAQLTDESLQLTQTEQVIGTLRYLSPEALDGEADHRSDVYSLGAALYELIALRPPYAERDRATLLRCLASIDPQPLTTVVPEVSRDLSTIVSRAMAREPDRRYATAGDLAADLHRFINREPIRARHVGAAEQLWLFARRRPLPSTLLAMLATVIIGSLVTLTYLWRSAVDAETEADSERIVAVEALDEADRNAAAALAASEALAEERAASELQLIRFEYEEATRLIEAGEHARALTLTDSTLERFALRQHDPVFQKLLASEHLPELFNAQPEAPATSRLGNTLVAGASGWALNESRSRHLSRAVSGIPLQEALRFRQRVLRSYQTSVVLDASVPDWDSFYQTRSRKLHPILEFPPDSEMLVLVNGATDRMLTWTPDGGVKQHSGERTRFTRDPDLQLVQDADGRLLVHRPDSGDSIELDTPSGYGDPSNADGSPLDFEPGRVWLSPDGTRLLAEIRRSGRGQAVEWDAATGRLVQRSGFRLRPYDRTKFSGNSGVVLIGQPNDTLAFGRGGVSESSPLARINAWHTAISSDGTTLAGSVLMSVQVHRLPSEDAARRESPRPRPELVTKLTTKSRVYTLSLSHDGGLLACGCEDGSLVLARTDGGNIQQSVRLRNAQIEVVRISEDGSRVLAGDRHGNVRVWDTQTYRPLTAPIPCGSRIVAAEWHPDGRRFGVLTAGGRLRIFSIHEDDSAARFSNDLAASDVTFSPDGSHIYIATSRGTQRLTRPGFEEAATGPPARRLILSPNGQYAVLWNDSQNSIDIRTADLSDVVLTIKSRQHSELPPQFISNDELLTVTNGAIEHVVISRGSRQAIEARSEKSQPVAIATSPDGQWIAAAFRDAHDGHLRLRVRAWHRIEPSPELNVQNGRPSWQLCLDATLPTGHNTNTMQFSPQSTDLAIGGTFGLAIWPVADEAEEGASPSTLSPIVHDDIRALDYSESGNLLSITNDSNELSIVDTSTWQRVGQPVFLSSEPLSIAFTEPPETMITVTRDGAINHWDWLRGRRLIPERNTNSTLTAAAISVRHHLISTTDRIPSSRVFAVDSP